MVGALLSLCALWTAGDPVKIGLALITIVFDVLLLIQHYVIYPEHGRQALQDPEGNGVTTLEAQRLLQMGDREQGRVSAGRTTLGTK